MKKKEKKDWGKKMISLFVDMREAKIKGKPVMVSKVSS